MVICRDHVTRITTVDTGKTYEFPGEGNPPLWEICFKLGRVNSVGGSCADVAYHDPHSIFVEQQTLVDAGLLPAEANPAEQGKISILELFINILCRVVGKR